MRSKGKALIKKIRAQIDKASANSAQWGEKRPSVLFILQPPGPSNTGMAGGSDTRAHTIIEMAGGRNAAESMVSFQPISNENLLALDPDIILMGQSPAHGGSEAAIRAFSEDSALSALQAVQNEAVYGVPLDDLAFGTRLGEAVLRWNKLFANAVRSE